MSRKKDVIHEWKEPKEVKRYGSGLMINMVKGSMPRVLIGTAVILLLLFWFFNHTLPEDVLPELNRGLVIVFVAAVLICSFCLAHPILVRIFGTTYKITDRKISTSDINGSNAVLWKHVKGYSLSEHQELPDAVSILVHSRKSRKMVLWVPKGELAEQITTTLSERCPLIQEAEEPRPSTPTLSDFEMLQLLLATLAYSVVGGYLLSVYKSPIPLRVIFGATLILGPGTIGCLFLYGRKAIHDKRLRALALVFNFLGLVLLMLTWALFMFYRWSEVIKDLPQ